VLRDFLLRHGDGVALLVESDGPRGGSTLVNGEDVLHGAVLLLVGKCPAKNENQAFDFTMFLCAI
jgi:hypothetical protein